MSKPWTVSTSDQAPDWTLGRWRRREYNTPERRAQLVTITEAARRLGIKPKTLTTLKFRNPATFPEMVVQSGTPQWYVWEEIARFAAQFGYGDPGLVAEARIEYLRYKLAEWASTLVRLQTEYRQGQAAHELHQRIKTARLQVDRWRKQLYEHLDPPAEKMRLPFRATPATLDVLSVLLSSGTAYALQIGRATGRKSGTVTPILRRLEDHGWITGAWDADGERRGPRRCWYRITPGYEDKVHTLLAQRNHPMLPPVA